MRYGVVRDAFARRPFHPLVVRVVGGTEYVVRTPECMVTPKYAAFIVKGGIIETVALEYIEAIRPSNGNGAARPRRARKQPRA